jgi:hypothetical protein
MIAAAQAAGHIDQGFDPFDVLVTVIALSMAWSPASTTFTASSADSQTEHDRRREVLRTHVARAYTPWFRLPLIGHRLPQAGQIKPKNRGTDMSEQPGKHQEPAEDYGSLSVEDDEAGTQDPADLAGTANSDDADVATQASVNEADET